MDYYTLDQAIKSGRVFVLNKSRPKGDILITFLQPGSGKSFIAKVPKTWIPIAISDTVPLQIILNSVDFRSYLALIPRDEAEKILESADGKEEQERIYLSKHAEEDSEINKKGKKQKFLNGNEDDNTEVDVQSFIRDENLLVKEILDRNVDNKVSVTLNELKSIEEEITKEDLIYIIKNTEGKIRTWAERKLNGNKKKK